MADDVASTRHYLDEGIVDAVFVSLFGLLRRKPQIWSLRLDDGDVGTVLPDRGIISGADAG
jgi:hypothetical protein